jgi:Ca2+-binding RTX toxin-like protein
LTTAVVADFASLSGLGATFVLSGTDASNFNLFGGQLFFANSPNFEAPTDLPLPHNNVYNVTVTATLGGTTAVQDLAVAVTNVNEAPVFTQFTFDPVNENTTAVGTVVAVDGDVGQTVSYTIVGGADAARFTITAAGVLAFNNPGPNFEAPADVGANNVYDIIVRATDNGNPLMFTDQAIAVSVADVNEAPVISSNGGLATAAISVAENTTAVTTVVAADPDAGNTVTYSIATGLGDDAGLFTINAATGELAFNPAPDFEGPTDLGTNNVYNVTVRASDGTLVDTQAIAVTVTNANDAGSGGITISTATRGPAANQVTLAAANTLVDPDGISAVNYTWRNAANTAVGTGPNLTVASNGAVQLIHLSATYTDPFGTTAVADALQTAVIGTTAANTINGTAGADFMFGFAGNDTLRASAGNDTIDGGGGTDTYDLSGMVSAATVNLATGSSSSADTGSDILVSIENVIGSSGVNTITGNTGNNVLSGLGGNDIISGGGGSDTLNGGSGIDILTGGNGADTITGGNGADMIYLGNITPNFGDSAVDRVVFSADTQYGDEVFEFASANAGQRDQVALTGALSTAINDGGLFNLLNINWASGSNSAAVNVAANITDPSGLSQNRVEALYLSGSSAAEGVTNANITDAGSVATAFDNEFAITSVTGNDALLVINDSNGNDFSVWQYVEAGGAEIQATELTLIGKFHTDGTVLTSQFILA